MGSFADQLAQFAAETGAKADGVVAEVVQEIGRRVIARSPVDTSAFQSNWNYGLETRDAFFSDKRLKNKTLNNLEELPKSAAGFVHWVSNAAPYGPALERGHSRQAPQGMVALTQLEFGQIVEQAALKVASRQYIALAVPYA